MSSLLNRWKLNQNLGISNEIENTDGEFSKGVSRAWENTKATTKAAIGAMGAEDYLLAADFNQREAQKYAPKVGRFTDIDSLSDAGNWLAGTAGESVVDIGTVLAGGGMGGVAARSAAKMLGSTALKSATRAGTIGGLVASNYPQQFGEDIQAVRAEHGGTLPEGSVPTMALTAVAQTALDTLPVMGVLGRLGLADKARGDILQKTLTSPTRIRQIGRDLGGTALKEGATEAAQEAMKLGALEWIDSNKDHFGVEQMKQLVDSFAAGAVGGAIMGAPVAGLNALHSDKPWFRQRPAETKEITSDSELLALPSPDQVMAHPDDVYRVDKSGEVRRAPANNIELVSKVKKDADGNIIQDRHPLLALPAKAQPHPDDVYTIDHTGNIVGYAPPSKVELKRVGIANREDGSILGLKPIGYDSGVFEDSVSESVNSSSLGLNALHSDKPWFRRKEVMKARAIKRFEESGNIEQFENDKDTIRGFIAQQLAAEARQAQQPVINAPATAIEQNVPMQTLATPVAEVSSVQSDTAKVIPLENSNYEQNTNAQKPLESTEIGRGIPEPRVSDAAILGDLPINNASPLSSPSSFTPTHELADGTPVVAHPEDAGIWVAKDGSEYEGSQAYPVQVSSDPSLVQHQKLIDQYQADTAKVEQSASEAALSPQEAGNLTSGNKNKDVSLPDTDAGIRERESLKKQEKIFNEYQSIRDSLIEADAVDEMRRLNEGYRLRRGALWPIYMSSLDEYNDMRGGGFTEADLVRDRFNVIMREGSRIAIVEAANNIGLKLDSGRRNPHEDKGKTKKGSTVTIGSVVETGRSRREIVDVREEKNGRTIYAKLTHYLDANGVNWEQRNDPKIVKYTLGEWSRLTGTVPTIYPADRNDDERVNNAALIQARNLPTSVNTANPETRKSLRGGNSEPMDDGMGDGNPAVDQEPTVSGGATLPSGGGKESVRGASRTGSSERQRAGGDVRSEPSATEQPVTPIIEPQQVAADNHTIQDEDQIGKGGQKAKYKDNVAAIKLLRELEQTGKKSTAADRKVLAKWVGWGGLKQVFDANNQQWAKEHQELKSLLSDEQYKAARASILNAHYTEPAVVKSIYAALSTLGFNQGRVLESSMGIGNFFGLMPKELRQGSQLFGVEKDEITALLAKHLYPNARVTHSGFEDYQVPAEFFDVAVGNPPFGSEPIIDSERSPYSGFSIHNYFFAKQIDKLREGGILINVVSHSLLDKMDTRQRAWIANKAKLVGAIRLPDSAFKENANTEVVTDIIILQRTKDGEGDGKDADWVHTDTVAITNPKTGETVQTEISRYFVKHPEKVLGEPSAGGTMYRGNSYTVKATGDWKAQLAEWAKSTFMNGEQPFQFVPIERSTKILDTADHVIPDGVKVGSYFAAADGSIYQRAPDAAGARQAVPVEHDSPLAETRIRGLIGLRDQLRQQMRLERSQDASSEQIEAHRTSLNKLYDDFVKKHGYLNSSTIRRLFSVDTEAQLLFALEVDYDKGLGKDSKAVKEGGEEARPASAKKADILQRRVLFPPEDDSLLVKTAKDALLASLNKFGFLDVAWMAKTADIDQVDLVKELSEDGVIFLNPDTGNYEEADRYLSGDVKTKLIEAENAAKSNPTFVSNVTALRKVIPKDLLPSQIPMMAGAHWIPVEHYLAFFKLISGRAIKVNHVAGQWIINSEGSTGNAALESSEYGTPRLSSYEIFKLTMQGKAVEVKDNLGTSREPKWVVNEEATQAAAEKQNKLKAKWEAWIIEDATRANELADLYNSTFNRIVNRKFDGSHLKLHGTNPAIQLRPSQKNAVWRSIQDRQVLYDHVVGAGKTFTAIAAVMEMRRLGIARKPLVTVPNHLTLQWRDDFMRLYPSANILAATPEDFSNENRKRLFSKIATNDWDAVIIGHSSLAKIGLPKDIQKEVTEELFNEISEAIERMKKDRGDRSIVRDMERIKANLEAKFKKQEEKTANKDKVVGFDELGIDGFFLDEAHEFKNLFFTTGRQRVAGLGNPAGSGKAFDLFVKLRWMYKFFGDKAPIVFMTGTPVSNSLAEMFTMQRYMQYPKLQEMKLHLFDNWAKMFGDDSAVYEVAPSGVGYRVSQRFARFRGLSTLMGLYYNFADTVTLDDLKQNALDAGKVFPIPKVKGGRPQIKVAPKSDLQKQFIGEPEIQFDEKQRPIFELNHVIDAEIKESGDGYVVSRKTNDGTVEQKFSDLIKAQDFVVSAALSPKVAFTSGSLLDQFANLANITRATKGKVNALSLTNLANKVGLDYRLIDPSAPDFPDSKINLAIADLVRTYHQWAEDKGTQLIFCDLSVPLSAKKALASKAARVYVRDPDGAITHRNGVLIAPEGYEGFAYFLVEKKKKGQESLFEAYDAASGVLVANSEKAKAATKDEFKAVIAKSLGKDARRDWWYEQRDQAGIIEQAEIDAYKDAKEFSEEEGTNELSLADIEGGATAAGFSIYDDMKAKLIAQGIPEKEIAFIHDYATPKAKAELFKAVNAGRVRFLFGSTPKMGAGTNVQERLVALRHIDAPWRPSDLEQREGRIIRQGNQLYSRDPDGFEVEISRYATEQTYDTRRWQIIQHKADGIQQLKKYDGVTQEIEDVTGEAANAAEMKAAASGSPLILKETELRAELQRLQALQKGHADEQAMLLRKISFNTDYIKHSAPQFLSEVKRLIKLTDAHPLKDKPAKGLLAAEINLDGKTYTERDSAEAVLSKTIIGMITDYKANRPVNAHQLKYRGLSLVIKHDFLTTMGIFIGSQKITDYSDSDQNISGAGLIQRLNNYIGRLPEHVKNIEKSVMEREQENKELQARMSGEFTQASELERVRSEHEKVRKSLMREQIRDAIKPNDRALVNSALDQRVADLRELGLGDAVDRWIQEQGGSIRFSRTGSAVGSAKNAVVDEKETRAFVERFRRRFNGIDIQVVDNFYGLPLGILEAAQQQAFDPSEIRGVYHDGVAYLVRENHRSVAEVEATLFHEIYAHGGFRKLFGENLSKKFNHLFLALGGTQKIIERGAQHGHNLQVYWDSFEQAGYSNEEKRAALVDELFAHWSQDQANASFSQKALQLAKEFYGAIRQWLREHGFTRLSEGSEADIAYLLKQAREALGKPSTPNNKGKPQFLRTPMFSRKARESGLSASGDADLWSELKAQAPKEGAARGKELLGKGWQWTKDHIQEVVKTGGLGLLTLRQLAEIGQQVVPAMQKYMALTERMLTERNQMADESGKLAQRWTKLDKATRQKLAFVMHKATLERVDPSLDQVPEPEILIRVADLEWREKLGLARPASLLTEIEPERLAVNDKTLKLLRKRYLEANNKALRSRGSRERFEQLKQVADSLLSDWKAAKTAVQQHERALPLFERLQQQFKNLSPEAQAIYTESRDMYESRFARKHQALIASINRSVMPDEKKKALARTLQQEFESAKLQGVYFPLHRQGAYFVRGDVKKEQVSETVYFKKAGFERINRGTGEVTQEANTWDSEEAAMRSANSRSDLIGKDLIAVEQDGGWVLKENPNEPVFLMFPTAAEAEREAARLQADSRYSGVRMGKLNKQNTQDELGRAGVLMQTMTAMKANNQDVPDEMYQLMLEMLPELSMRKNSIHRKGVQGFSADALNAFGHQMLHQAHQISKLEARDQLAQALSDIEEQAKLVPNEQRMLAGNLREEMKKRHDWVMSPKNAAWTNWASSFGFVMYLGVSPAAALVNLSQVAIVGYPALAAKYGWVEAAKVLNATARQLNLREVVLGDDAIARAALSADERVAMEHWHDMGVIDKSQAQMLAGVADNDALSNSPAYQRAMGMVAHLFHKAEVVNREVMLLSAYRLARAKGEAHEQAVQYASDVTWETQFDYSNANRAGFMQNDFAKVALMFKSHSQHMIYFLLRNARQWGKGGADAKAARSKLLGILAVTLAMGGVSALPLGFVGAATGFAYAQAKFGTKAASLGTVGAVAGLMLLSAAVLDEEEDWESELRKALRSIGGEPLETLVFRGTVNLTTGVDLSSRISLDDLLMRESDRELEGADAKGALLEQLAGPVVGYGVNALYTVPELWSQDHEWRAVEKLMPKFARDWMQTARFGTEGALTMKGSPIVERDFLGLPYSDELNVWNLFWKANGFNAEKLTGQYVANNDFMNAKKRVQASREKVLNRLFVASVENDRKAILEAKKAIKDWNQAHPQAKQINEAAMKRSLAARLRARRENDQGVRVQAAEVYLRE